MSKIVAIQVTGQREDGVQVANFYNEEDLAKAEEGSPLWVFRQILEGKPLAARGIWPDFKEVAGK